MLKVNRIINGLLEENCYIIYNEKECLVIDPGSESKRIIDNINKNNLTLKGILITHYHFDHIGALEDIKNEYKIDKVYDFNMNSDQRINNFNFRIIHNPGHTKDSVSFYFYEDNLMFSGDFIFKGTIGNYKEDDEIDMNNSLNEFKKLNKNIIIYPGHGESTTYEDELKYNMFLI